MEKEEEENMNKNGPLTPFKGKQFPLGSIVSNRPQLVGEGKVSPVSGG